jgi:hypothetical protein
VSQTRIYPLHASPRAILSAFRQIRTVSEKKSSSVYCTASDASLQLLFAILRASLHSMRRSSAQAAPGSYSVTDPDLPFARFPEGYTFSFPPNSNRVRKKIRPPSVCIVLLVMHPCNSFSQSCARVCTACGVLRLNSNRVRKKIQLGRAVPACRVQARPEPKNAACCAPRLDAARRYRAPELDFFSDTVRIWRKAESIALGVRTVSEKKSSSGARYRRAASRRGLSRRTPHAVQTWRKAESIALGEACKG